MRKVSEVKCCVRRRAGLGNRRGREAGAGVEDARLDIGEIEAQVSALQ